MLEIPWRTRTMGLEYEFTRSVSQETLAAAIRLGIPNLPENKLLIRDWEHNHNNREWMVKRDGSCGWEIISPCLSGSREELLTGVSVLGACRQLGAKVDPACGVHLHYGFNEGSKALYRVLRNWIRLEGLVLWSLPRSRRRNRYCLPLSKLPERLVLGGSHHDFLCLCANNRYRALNIVPHSQGMDRIEFRLVEATTDPQTVMNWSMFFLYFIERARGRDCPGRQWWSLREALEWLGWLSPDKPGEESDNLSAEVQALRCWWLRRILHYGSDLSLGREVKRQARALLKVWRFE